MLLVLTDLLHIKYPLLHSEFVFKDQGFYFCVHQIFQTINILCVTKRGVNVIFMFPVGCSWSPIGLMCLLETARKDKMGGRQGNRADEQ